MTEEEIKPEQIRKAEIEARVAEKKTEWQTRKEKFKGKAVKISNEILKGIDLSENAYVKLIDGSVGEVVIRPLAEGEMMGIIADVGIDVLQELGKSQFSIKDYDFFWSIVSASTDLEKELIKKTFAVGESAILGNRILEISGFASDTEQQIEDF